MTNFDQTTPLREAHGDATSLPVIDQRRYFESVGHGRMAAVRGPTRSLNRPPT